MPLPSLSSSCPQEVCQPANRELSQGTESSTRASRNSTLWKKAQWDKGETGGRDVPSLRPWARPIYPVHALRKLVTETETTSLGFPSESGFSQRPWDQLKPKQGPSAASLNYPVLCHHAALWVRNGRSPKTQVLKTFSCRWP